MAERDRYDHGVFNWIDLCTEDTEAAKEFYAALFGLSFSDETDEAGNVYTLGLKNDQPVVGLLAKPSELEEMGIPDCWETYIKVDDVEAALAKVGPAGGTTMGPVIQVSEAGRMGLVADPTGGVVILWEPIDHQGAHLVNEHGTQCWNELVTSDVDTAMAFYSEVLGWTPVPLGMNDMVGIRQGADMIGTIAPLPAEGVPTHWSVYFAVDDCNATVEQCLSLGGSVNVPPMDVPPGRMAHLADDQGAVFWVITLNPDFSMD